MSNDEIAVKYNAKDNLNGYTVDGAPLRDIPADEWAKLPEQVQRSVAAAVFYEVTPKGKRTAETANLAAVTLAIPGISGEIVAALAAAGYDTPDKITAAHDEELMAIPGIKQGRLAQIRAALADIHTDFAPIETQPEVLSGVLFAGLRKNSTDEQSENKDGE